MELLLGFPDPPPITILSTNPPTDKPTPVEEASALFVSKPVSGYDEGPLGWLSPPPTPVVVVLENKLAKFSLDPI